VKYGAILCDPPWAFAAWSHKGITTRSAESHYRTSHTASLADLPVRDLAARDCALFMWTVDSHLDQGIALMQSWGFAYKTIAFIWVKTKPKAPHEPRMGMGLWTRKEAEVCLMGRKGDPRRQSGGVRQVIMEPRREHSRKPDAVYDRVQQLVPGPYVELFARQRWPGWDTAFSDEADKFEAAA
jgi:N6-adenosine-specific RNA methylase IME4